jgi:hypothetical protein
MSRPESNPMASADRPGLRGLTPATQQFWPPRLRLRRMRSGYVTTGLDLARDHDLKILTGAGEVGAMHRTRLSNPLRKSTSTRG